MLIAKPPFVREWLNFFMNLRTKRRRNLGGGNLSAVAPEMRLTEGSQTNAKTQTPPLLCYLLTPKTQSLHHPEIISQRETDGI